MEILVSLTIGALVAIGIWMMLDRGLLRVVLGVVVLGNGVNLAVFSAGRLDGRAAAFVTEAGAPALAANPLPQALVLTAIVIGFALFVFALAVLERSWALHGHVETDRITAVAEEPAPDLPAPPKFRFVPAPPRDHRLVRQELGVVLGARLLDERRERLVDGDLEDLPVLGERVQVGVDRVGQGGGVHACFSARV